MSSSDESDYTAEIEEATADAISTVVPEKSKAIYELAYKHFNEWLQSKKITSVSEKVMLAYFNIKSKTLQSSSMWSLFSKLKCMINLHSEVNIGHYTQLVAFLKRKSVAHKAKKSKILTRNDFERFIKEADDNEHFLLKVKLKFDRNIQMC